MDVDPSNPANCTRKSLLPQFTPAHLFFSSYSRCLIRNGLRAQSESRSWTLITVSLICFHHLRIPLPWSYPLFVLKDTGVAPRFVRLAKLFTNSSDSFARFHGNDGPSWRSWLLPASSFARSEDTAGPLFVVEGFHKTEILSVNCAGRLSFVEAFDVRWWQ